MRPRCRVRSMYSVRNASRKVSVGDKSSTSIVLQRPRLACRSSHFRPGIQVSSGVSISFCRAKVSSYAICESHMNSQIVKLQTYIRNSRIKNIDKANNKEIILSVVIFNSRIENNGKDPQPAIRPQTPGPVRSPGDVEPR